MSFTEFYTDNATGFNINAGDNTANGVVTSTNGAWSTVTNIFIATGGTPFSGVVAGDFVSLYADGATVAAYVARITAVGGGGLTLTLSSTSKSGTAPSTSATGISATTGGKWKGPNGAENFPFDIIDYYLSNVADNRPRINMKNTSTYNITANLQGRLGVTYQGYTATAGDGGKATIDGGTTGASYKLLSSKVSDNGSFQITDLIFQNNGDTGSADGVSLANVNAGGSAFRCVFSHMKGVGLFLNSYDGASECEAYSCGDGFSLSLGPAVERCIAHDNVRYGFYMLFGGVSNCIAFNNGSDGFFWAGYGGAFLANCDAYNNTGSGAHPSSVNPYVYSLILSNCNFVKNGAYGVDAGSGVVVGVMNKCAFGSGTQANASGTVNNFSAVTQNGTITLTANTTPWASPSTGDFRITSAQCRGTGDGNFTETAPGISGTIGYPDIGAAQHLTVGSAFAFVD